jgi:tellurite methyltransferase
MNRNPGESAVPSWEAYYQRIEGRGPRPLLLEALSRFSEDPSPPIAGNAIDLGFGDGTETLELLAAGWHVLAIDNEPSAAARLKDSVPSAVHSRLEISTKSFADAVLSETDLLFAGMSLPFCHPAEFDHVWAKIVAAIRPGGRFAGHFLGVRDEWADHDRMTFLTRSEVLGLFHSRFDVEYFKEREQEAASSGGPKKWHLFEAVAKRRRVS